MFREDFTPLSFRGGEDIAALAPKVALRSLPTIKKEDGLTTPEKSMLQSPIKPEPSNVIATKNDSRTVERDSCGNIQVIELFTALQNQIRATTSQDVTTEADLKRIELSIMAFSCPKCFDARSVMNEKTNNAMVKCRTCGFYYHKYCLWGHGESAKSAKGFKCDGCSERHCWKCGVKGGKRVTCWKCHHAFCNACLQWVDSGALLDEFDDPDTQRDPKKPKAFTMALCKFCIDNVDASGSLRIHAPKPADLK